MAGGCRERQPKEVAAAMEGSYCGKEEAKWIQRDESEGFLPGEELTAVVEEIDFLLNGIGGMKLRKK